MIWIFLTVLLSSVISLFGTEAVRRYALRTSMIDRPNARSSHTVPTPRGGGLAIVVAILVVLGLLLVLLPDQRKTTIGILGGGLLIAIIGLADDRFDLSAKVRLCAQFLSAIWLLAWLGGTGPVGLMGWDLRLVALPSAVLFVIWSTNVYNFMDGLDGFAGVQAVVAATAAALLASQAGDTLLAFTMLATSGAAAGFLVWNWPPAKIFMGDCGSGFLGFLFAATALAAHRHGTFSIGSSMMLLSIFFVDATLTLLRRIAQGEKWYEAHRSHAYQLATQLGANHKQVTLCALGLFATAACLAIMLEWQTRWSTLLAITYATAVVGIWLAINWLFVGRTQTLTSINSQKVKEQSTPEETSTGTHAKVFYLRFRRFQSQLRSWRSTMPHNDLLAEATGIASQLGYTVSHDWLDGCGSGNVQAAGEKWILLDFNMTKRDQIRQILLIIQEEAEQLELLSDNLRSALELAASDAHQLNKAA